MILWPENLQIVGAPPEVRATITLNTEYKNSPKDVMRKFSRLRKLINVSTYVIRFDNNIAQPEQKSLVV